MSDAINRIEITDFEEKAVYYSPPHAPALVTTISPDGNTNLAPFEQVMMCSDFPPKILLGITPESDTARNIREHLGEFVVGFPSEEILDETYASGEKLDRSESEFELTGLTPADAKLISPPRIKECKINMECVLDDVFEYGGDHVLIVGSVKLVDMCESIYDEDKVTRRLNIDPLYYASSGVFYKKGSVIKADKSKLIAEYKTWKSKP